MRDDFYRQATIDFKRLNKVATGSEFLNVPAAGARGESSAWDAARGAGAQNPSPNESAEWDEDEEESGASEVFGLTCVEVGGGGGGALCEVCVGGGGGGS